MKSAFLIIGDIHIHDESDVILEKYENIFNAIKNLYYNTNNLFILIPGDIAFSGKEEQYTQFYYFLERIIEKLNKYKKNDIYIILSPGNHDCNFDHDTESRSLMITNILEDRVSNYDDDLINICTVVQNEYFQFVELQNNENNIIFKDKLLTIHKNIINDLTIYFYSYNLSWMSKKNEKYGQLYFPLEKYNKELFDNNDGLRISIFHHPIWWLKNNSNRIFLEHLSKTSDIIFTGHEHNPDEIQYSSKNINNISIYESGALQTHGDDFKSEFRYFEIDNTNKKYRNIVFSYNGNTYIPDKNIDDWNESNLSDWSKVLNLDSSFLKTILDPGANYLHPNKEILQLNDFYIFPLLNDISEKYFFIDNNGKNIKEIDSIELVNLNRSKIIISGSERIGKTSLLFNLFLRFYDIGYTPIFIEGTNIKNTTDIEIRKTIKKAFNSQYTNIDQYYFDQLDRDKIIIIIDDIDHCSFNKKFFTNLFKTLNDQYNNIIISSDEVFGFEDIFYRDDSNKEVFDSFRFYKIKPFGHYLRKKIIKKWQNIGNEVYKNGLDTQHSIIQRLNIVNTIIGNNLVPSFPFYILTILQTIEAGIPNNLEKSSYGYYYDFLITSALQSVHLENKEMYTYNNLLSEFAYHLYLNKDYSLSKEAFTAFFNNYIIEYDLSLKLDEVTTNLLNAKIINNTSNEYYFNYKYLYYYYLAKYIADNINEDKVSNEIVNFAKKSYHSFNSNVLMFLTHLSKNPLIIECIIDEAKNCFRMFSEIELEKDITIINELIDEVPELVIKNISAEKAHDDQLRHKDNVINKNEEANGIIEYPKEEEKEEEAAENNAFNLTIELNKSFKSIELLGQIGKNYYGSIKGEIKDEISNEGFSICLRALCSYFDFLKKNLNTLVNEISEYAIAKKIEKDEDVKKIVNRFIFNMSSLISFYFIKKTAQLMSTRDLEITFSNLIKRNSIISRRLLDIAIKLDYSSKIPEKEVYKLNYETSSNFLANYILRRLITDHLYMFDTEHDTKQRLCEKLKISLEIQKNIILQSKTNKY